MTLSDVSVTRPVFATVLGLLLIVFGIASFERLPLRQYPNIDPPIVSVETFYPGASAAVVETRITQIIEDRIAGVEGIEFISSSSTDGRSAITIEFDIGRDVDGAANDIRDRVAGVLNSLPEEADPPEIEKVDSNQDVIMWMNLVSENMTVPELTDYADRYLVDRFSTLDGVARVQIGGAQAYAMRIWLDRNALAARGLTVDDVENALRAENVELPAGAVESESRQFTVRLSRAFQTEEDFARLVLDRGGDGYLVRLGDVARVERSVEESRTFFRGNGVPQVGLGIIKQSTANTIDVAKAAKAEAAHLNPTLPEGMTILQSYDSSVFIEGAINEVYKTLFIALGLVIVVIFLFLGDIRATLIPAIVVPVSVLATFIALFALGFSINLLTLLALVLAIGLVVDDAIVVLENIYRRMDTLGETSLVASYRGARQVGFAVIATTLVLISVFTPLAFLQGDIGRIFSEFALTMAAAVAFSSLLALSVCPMLASKILKSDTKSNGLIRALNNGFANLEKGYARILGVALKAPAIIAAVFTLLAAGTAWLYTLIPSEYAPAEDRGSFFIFVSGPEGATFSYMQEYMDEVEDRLMPLVDNGEIQRLLVRAPASFSNFSVFNNGAVIVVLSDWADRRNAFDIIADVRQRLSDMPGVFAFPIMRQGFGASTSKPVQFVIGGGSYDELAEWRDILMTRLDTDNPGLVGIDWDYKETQPQLDIDINYDRAAELGVTVNSIGRTLETMLGSRRVTTYIEDGEEYDVIVEGERAEQNTAADLQNIYVRSDRSDALIPLSNLVSIEEYAGSNTLNRYNRIRALTMEANLSSGLTLGEALFHMEQLVQEHLPAGVVIDYKDQSLDFKSAGQSLVFVFLLGLAIVFLVLAAQFESFKHPLIIMLTAPIVIGGGLLGLALTGGTLNLYSQIGLIMLIGLAAKNGILIVEFANQLRDRGQAFEEALKEAAKRRFRPIVMTGITTAAGSLPLILSSGAGAETRSVIGIVILSGVLAATILTLIVTPVAYNLIARRTGSTGDVQRRLEQEQAKPAAAE